MPLSRGKREDVVVVVATISINLDVTTIVLLVSFHAIKVGAGERPFDVLFVPPELLGESKIKLEGSLLTGIRKICGFCASSLHGVSQGDAWASDVAFRLPCNTPLRTDTCMLLKWNAPDLGELFLLPV